jgi:hypothetical protein
MYTFPDFAQRGAMPQATIDAYRERVPAELVEFWQQYGTGSFLEGYIRVIDPAEYEPAIGDCIGRVIGGSEAVPVMVTGLADLIAWEPGKGFRMVQYRNEDTRGLGATVDVFLGLLELDGTEELDDNWDWSAYRDAVAAHGPLAHDESFVYVPLLSLGGRRAAENLKPRKTIEAIRMMVELQGLVEH